MLDGARASPGDVSSVVTPVFNVDQDTNLTFMIYFDGPSWDKHTQLEVYLREAHGVKQMLEATYLSQQVGLWLEGTICIPKGSHRVVFTGSLAIAPNTSIAIDDVRLAGPCTYDDNKRMNTCEYSKLVFCMFVCQ